MKVVRQFFLFLILLCFEFSWIPRIHCMLQLLPESFTLLTPAKIGIELLSLPAWLIR